jgi:Mg-chelatase subunit ChlD
MKTKVLGIGLFALTLAALIYYPGLQASATRVTIPDDQRIDIPRSPRIDVVFVLDTTGSMGGLIQTAKEKIWSIATTFAAAQPTPEIRIGLVAYRDKGDQYETRIIDLSDDLDSVYAHLMEFQADGGGDGPESVNRALYDAVNRMSWSKGEQLYQAIFLVGDAPPHMDYNEMRYPQIVANAARKGIVVNTIQCGEMNDTIEPWTQIASLGQGSYFQVEQAGGALAFNTPFDANIADLSARLDATRLYFGSEEEKAEMANKVAATDTLHAKASVASRARRGVFNAGAAGRGNLLGQKELVDAVASGEVNLDELDDDALPEALKPMAPAEQEAYVADLARERSDLERQIRDLAEQRTEYIAKRVSEEGTAEDSLDYRLYEAVKEQAGKAGFDYADGPAY